MPRARQTERVVVVRTDLDGNILDYDVVHQPIHSAVVEKPSSVNRSRSLRQSPKVNRMETYEQEEQEEEEEKQEELEDDDEDEEIRDNSTFSITPLKKPRQDTAERRMPKLRRVRYVRPKSTVKIFAEPVEWNANKKIDTNNDEAIRRIHNAPKSKVFREKLAWRVKPRIDSHNETVVENLRRSASKPQIFTQKPVWNAEPKIDAHNEEFIENHRRSPKYQKIYDEKLKWEADPKIDSHNEEIVERLKSAPKPIIYDEKFAWPSTPRIDHHNEEYIKHKEREKIIQKEKSFVQNFPQERNTKADRARIDHHNPNFEEHKKRQKSEKLPPIEDRKLEWQKKPRINQKNDDYIERLRQKRSIPLIFREKVKWNTKTSKIDAHNEEYVENLKEQTRPKIISKLPRWKAQSKIDAFNESYDSNSYEKPIIVNEKLRWHARPKIDTGLEPESEEDEYNDNDSAA